MSQWEVQDRRAGSGSTLPLTGVCVPKLPIMSTPYRRLCSSTQGHTLSDLQKTFVQLHTHKTVSLMTRMNQPRAKTELQSILYKMALFGKKMSWRKTSDWLNNMFYSSYSSGAPTSLIIIIDSFKRPSE